MAMNSGFPITYHHITVQIENVLSFLLAFLAIGLVCGLAVQRLGLRDNRLANTLAGIFETVGWGFIVLMPSMLVFVAATPSLTYGSAYWGYLGDLWFYGIVAMLFVFVDRFVFDKPFSRILARLVPRNLRAALRKPQVIPSYIRAWMVGQFFSFP